MPEYVTYLLLDFLAFGHSGFDVVAADAPAITLRTAVRAPPI